MITFTTFSDPASYADSRYSFILGVEEGGIPKLDSYVDSQGIPSIGVGFNLRTTAGNQGTIFSELNITDTGLQHDLANVFDTIYVRQPGETQSQLNARLAADINAVMANHGAGTFHFTDNDAVRRVFNQVVQTVTEPFLNQWSNGIPGGIPESFERIALLSLAYNLPSLLGNKLYGALQAGNRAEAWFEIRFASNADQQHANRRYQESDLFGLYDDISTVSEQDAVQVLRMYGNHSTEIGFYQSQFPPSGAGSKTIEESLRPADTLIINKYVTQESIPVTVNAGVGHVLVGNDVDVSFTDRNNRIVERFRADDNLVGSGENDLILGFGGNDTLVGQSGDDILYGGKGNDTLKGDTGNDVMIGGEDRDTYVVNGNDRIINTGGIIKDRDGRVIAGAFIDRGDGVFQWVQDSTTTGTQNSPFTVHLANGSSVVLDDFQSGDFGIQLRTIPFDEATTRTVFGDLEPIDFQNQRGQARITINRAWPLY